MALMEFEGQMKVAIERGNNLKFVVWRSNSIKIEGQLKLVGWFDVMSKIVKCLVVDVMCFEFRFNLHVY